MSEIKQIEQEIFAALKQKEEFLEKLRQSGDSLIEKWQRFLGLILPVQLMVIRQHGFPGNQKGFADFNKRLMEEANKDSELKKLSDEKWLFLFDKTFGLKELRTITLEKARTLTREITAAMTAETFLKEIDRVIETIDKSSMLERRQRLLDILLPIQKEIMGRHGFSGDEGYIQAQRAMMDHFYDSVVMEEAKKAQDALFKRAKMM